MEWTHLLGGLRAFSALAVLLLAGCSSDAPIKGAWTWFSDPRAIPLPGGQTLVGAVSQDGAIEAVTLWRGYAHTTRLSGAKAPDDHDVPAFLRLPNGRILAFVTRHNGHGYYVAKSTLPGTGLWFNDPVDIAPQLGGRRFSYANPVLLSSGEILLFYRGGNPPDWTMYVSQSSDGGNTWSRGRPLLSGGRPYLKLATHGDRIDFLVTDGHPDKAPRNGVYHFYRDAAGQYRATDGRPMGAPPFRTSGLTRLSAPDSRGWIWEIAWVDGTLLAAFQSDGAYYLARLDDARWRVSRIMDAGDPLYPGEPYYKGGMAIAGPGLLFLSTRSNGATTLYRAERQGAQWAAAPLAQGFRPVVVGGTVAYLSGRYSHYRDFDTRILTLPLSSGR